jgi:glycosyltransferase involved in cell wall biosynthesis
MQSGRSKSCKGGRRTRGDGSIKDPLVSIITVVYRARGGLEEILENVTNFEGNDFELIVIDGGSDDGTVDVLREWDDKIDYWLSEPDSGIYDAMNKGIAAAHGEYVFHLNAGDTLKSIPSETLALCLKDGVDVAAFRVLIDGKREFCPSNDRKLRVKNTLHHQGTFYRRATLPLYDIQYKVYADFDLNQRVVIKGAKVRIFDNVVAEHSTAGISNTAAAAESEHYRIIRKNHGRPYVAVSWVQRKWDGVMVRLGCPSLKV